MTTREILTLQFGHYSNYVGAHFWNIQEFSFDYTGTLTSECNNDILYREGETNKSETTYTPRLLLVDLKNSLKTLPISGGLPDGLDSQEILWENVETIIEPPAPKNKYLEDINDPCQSAEKDYNLETQVKTWTDFLYPRFHSRTVHILNDLQCGNHEDGFGIYVTGQNIWKSDFGDNFANDIRKYVEECDSIQGFQINFDCTDGFSGLALSCMEHLADEYEKQMLAHPIIASYFPDNNPTSQEERDKSNLKDSIRLANITMSIESLGQYASMFIPLCTSEKGWRQPGNPRQFEYINYNPELYYHSSAILAAAMDTLSQKYRHTSNYYTLSDLCADITGHERKMAAATLGLPFELGENNYIIEQLNTVTKPIYTTITPSCKIASDKIFQLMTVRGVPESYLKLPGKAKDQISIPAYRCNNLQEIFELYFQSTNFLSPTNVTIAEKALALKTPFPKFFSDKLNKFGFVKSTDRHEIAESVPVIAGYHNGNFISNTIEKLHRDTSRIRFSKLHMFKNEGLEEAEFKETLDKLAAFKDKYEDGFQL